jgi:hypothetical protein
MKASDPLPAAGDADEEFRGGGAGIAFDGRSILGAASSPESEHPAIPRVHTAIIPKTE